MSTPEATKALYAALTPEQQKTFDAKHPKPGQHPGAGPGDDQAADQEDELGEAIAAGNATGYREQDPQGDRVLVSNERHLISVQSSMRPAVDAALVAAGGRRILAVVVVGEGTQPVTPCGGCRQKLREFAADDLPVIVANLQQEQARFLVRIGRHEHEVGLGARRHADQVDDRAKHFFPRQVQAVIRIDHQRWGNIEAL